VHAHRAALHACDVAPTQGALERAREPDVPHVVAEQLPYVHAGQAAVEQDCVDDPEHGALDCERVPVWPQTVTLQEPYVQVGSAASQHVAVEQPDVLVPHAMVPDFRVPVPQLTLRWLFFAAQLKVLAWQFPLHEQTEDAPSQEQSMSKARRRRRGHIGLHPGSQKRLWLQLALCPVTVVVPQK
jgi:hypothetical protein